jgi:hypothetical protein
LRHLRSERNNCQIMKLNIMISWCLYKQSFCLSHLHLKILIITTERASSGIFNEKLQAYLSERSKDLSASRNYSIVYLTWDHNDSQHVMTENHSLSVTQYILASEVNKKLLSFFKEIKKKTHDLVIDIWCCHQNVSWRPSVLSTSLILSLYSDSKALQ